MDPYSSGEDLVIKTRKPYTITKQRERWTEEEHNRFLEALKLYGRAWQRIEEHIGTKTAVQIRSHAQKFFTKLEKEAIVKGVPVGHAFDIEIPPPRPKRKPSNPYPRKTSVGNSFSHVGVKDGETNPVTSSCQSAMTVDLGKAPEKPCDDGKLGNSNEYHDKDDCSETFTLLNPAPFESPSSAKKISSSDAPKKPCTFRQYVPFSEEASNQDETAASQVTIEAKIFETEKSDNQVNSPFKISNVVGSYLSQEKSTHVDRSDELKQFENVDVLRSADNVHASQNYPRHVPVHILDGSVGFSDRNISQDMSYSDCMFRQTGGVQNHQNLFMNPAASAASEHCGNATRSVHQSFPSYHPVFNPIQNQDDYQSFLHTSTTFSSLIISALSQNPAAYAAASFAATLWPCMNLEAPAEPSSASAGAFQSRPISTTPSVAAIAAATVAAATAWWAAHGILPLCAPFHPGSTCSPASATPINSSQGRAGERRENNPGPALGTQKLEPECSEALHEQHSVSKSPILSSDSEASEGAKLDVVLAGSETAKVEDTAELHDANKSKNKTLVDRSSCGSNTPSSSDVEADGLEKHNNEKEENNIKDKEEAEEVDAFHLIGDPFSRRCRTTSNVNDSWKEVSEGGRLAFQALFSREVLPQSFSPPHDIKNTGKKNCNTESEKDENGLQLDLNKTTWGDSSQKQYMDDTPSLFGENKEEGLLNMGLGHGKLKARRTGFKPYKRCSMEAKDCRVSINSHDEEKVPKRLRMEGEAST